MLDWLNNTADAIFRGDRDANKVRFGSGIRDLHVTGGATTVVIGEGGYVDSQKVRFNDDASNHRSICIGRWRSFRPSHAFIIQECRSDRNRHDPHIQVGMYTRDIQIG